VKLLWVIPKFLQLFFLVHGSERMKFHVIIIPYTFLLMLELCTSACIVMWIFSFFSLNNIQQTWIEMRSTKNIFRWWKKRFVKVFIPSILTYHKVGGSLGGFCVRILRNGNGTASGTRHCGMWGCSFSSGGCLNFLLV
jgi:hypothetical protein